MSGRIVLAGFAAVSLIALGAAAAIGRPEPAASIGLQAPEAFAGIKNKRERSLALFAEAGKVIQHPRCLNCHPATDRPTQGMAMTPHQPWVVRGKNGHGAPGMKCQTCHQVTNVDSAGVPGHPEWHLAPAEMAWQGKSLGDICRQLKDRRRNGGKTMAQMVDHMATDSLVGWGWEPGVGRQPAPGTQAQFGALFDAWAKSGAYCPA